MRPFAKLVISFFCFCILIVPYQSYATPSVKSGDKLKPAASKEAPDEKWEYYASDEEDTRYYYSPDTIKRLKSNNARVQVKAFYAEKNAKYRDAGFQWEIDCTKKKLRGITASAKKKDGTTANLTKSSEWSPIPSDSTAEILFEKVCRKTGLKKP